MTSVTDLPTHPDEQWRGVDEGWGRQAVVFATLHEPTNCREYVTMHHRLGVGAGDRLLDIACGSGLAIELAGLRGALCAGIDASPRLVAVARDRSPEADVRVGDMKSLPWDDGSFDVVTSFRGIWGTTPEAVAEAYRVLVPGGRIGITVWGHIKASPGAWAFAPFSLAAEPKVQHQAAMVALGRPGVGEELLLGVGLTDVERIHVPFVLEFADPETYARALASTGPAFEAIQAVGEKTFLESAAELGRQQIREGLLLRAPIDLVGYIAAKPVRRGLRHGDAAEPTAEQSPTSFLSPPPNTRAAEQLFDEDRKGIGYVSNVSRLWAHLPTALTELSDLMGETTRAASLSFAQRAVLVTAAASSLGDSYCSLAWGRKLAEAASPDVAATIIRGGEEGLGTTEQALAHWARLVTRDPNAISADDVQALRDVGFDDSQIFAVTAFVALRLAFSIVNDALGADPDQELRASVPEPVRSAVAYGRGAESRGRQGAGTTVPAEQSKEMTK